MVKHLCEGRAPDVGVHLGGQIERRAENVSRASARIHRVILGILPDVRVTRNHRHAVSVIISAFMHQQIEGQPSKKPKNMERKWSTQCVFQDTEHPKSSSISRNCTKVLGPTQDVKFSQNTRRHITIRERKGLSLGVIQRTSPHERSLYAPEFEDRLREEGRAQCVQRMMKKGNADDELSLPKMH